MDRAPLLIVEIDPGTAGFLSEQLAADGHETRVARSLQHTLALFSQAEPALVLLGDLEPPRASLDTLETLRDPLRLVAPTVQVGARAAGVPILVLSARHGELDVLRAFDAGADDFMAKPFSYPQLRARCEALLRRAEPVRRSTLRVGSLEVDVPGHSVFVAGRRVALRKREYELLVHLASDPERVFTKHELLRDVWGFRADGATRTLDSHASRLRRKLAGSDGFVENVWGVGYCLRRRASTAPGSATVSA